MSLAQAVLEIAHEMEVSDWGETPVPPAEIEADYRSIAKQLRIAVKASEGSPQVQALPDLGIPPLISTVIGGANKRILEKSQENLQECMSTIKKVEKASSGMVELVGNPHSDIPEFMPIDEQIPVGATPIVNGAVYRMEADGRLHFQEEPTRQLRARYSKT